MNRFIRIIIQKGNKYLLIKESKETGYNAWNFPGGKVETDETPINAAKRELFEEINIQTDSLLPFYESEFQFDNQLWHGFYFISLNIDLANLKIMEQDKCDGYCFFSLEEIKNLKTGIPSFILSLLKP